VLSERLWKREFAGDPAVIGRPILINGRPFDVIGVAARYHGPEVACRVAAGASRDESGSQRSR
jgi:hypothetical protein